MQHYLVDTTVLQSGERVPALYRENPYGPVISVLLYVTIHRRHHPARTLLNDVRVVGRFFEWWSISHPTTDDLEGIFREGECPLTNELEDFARWLRTGPRWTADVSTPRPAQSRGVLKAATLDNYMQALKGFLIWTLRRNTRSAKGGRRDSRRTITETLQHSFRSIRLRGRTPELELGLEASHIDRLYEVVNPQSPENPFRKHLRLRNTLMVSIFHQTGLRRGELLKLVVDDVVCDPHGQPYVVVDFRANDPMDPRRNEPAQKTRSRRLAILPKLHQMILEYINHNRRPIRDGRRIKLAHSYLFVSERGLPLAESDVNHVMARLGSIAFRGKIALYPHLLRTTFCIEMMDHLIDVQGLGEDAAKDRLREYCGWSAASEMPERYTRKRIRREANKANLQRLRVARALLNDN